MNFDRLFDAIKGDAILFRKLPKPLELDKINPEIVFYRRINNVTEEIMKINHESIPRDVSINLESNAKCRCKRIIFVTHGFTHTIDEPWLKEIKDALVEVDDQIVAVVGWGEGAKSSIMAATQAYTQAVANCMFIGEWLSKYVELIYWSIKSTYIYPNNDPYIWGIGHSLGAHLMGIAGHRTQYHSDIHNPTLPNKIKMFKRITGLDPAGPGFQTELCGYRRLSKTDADMVDVIHTDGGLTPPYFGTLLPLGTIDFYPNFGHSTTKSKFNIDNHILAYKCFIWSIKNKGKFKTGKVLDGTPTIKLHPGVVTVNPIYKTKNVIKEAEMGYYADQVIGLDGNYYLKINKEAPFTSYKEEEKYAYDEL